MPKPVWSAYEDDVLSHLWGSRLPSRIARECNRQFGRRRTTRAVIDRARKLGLPRYSDVIKSVWMYARDSGYSRTRIETAIKRLRLKPSRVGRFKRALTQEQQRKIAEFLATVPDGQRLTRAVQGQWGGVRHDGRPKPVRCIDCDRDDVPHFCRGRCRSCDRRWRASRRPVSFGGGTERRVAGGDSASAL